MSYGSNDWGLSDCTNNGLLEEDPGYAWGDNSHLWGVNESQVKMPADFIAYGESDRAGQWDQLSVQDLHDWCFGWSELPGNPHPRNATAGANFGFFDGHVVWSPTWKRFPDITGSGTDTISGAGIPDGVLLSDYAPGGNMSLRDQRYRMMWSRDYQPHMEYTN